MDSDSFGVFALLLFGALFAVMVASLDQANHRAPAVNPQDLQQSFFAPHARTLAAAVDRSVREFSPSEFRIAHWKAAGSRLDQSGSQSKVSGC